MRLQQSFVATIIICAAIGLGACNDDPDGTDASNGPDTTDAADVTDAADAADAARDARSDAVDAQDTDDAFDRHAYFEQHSLLQRQLLCKRLYDCREQLPAVMLDRYSAAAPRAACPELLEPRYISLPVNGSIDSGGIAFDAQAAQACLDAFESAVSANGCPDLEGEFDVCDDVLTPMVPEGGSCLLPNECAGDTYCTNNLFDNVCSGTCEPTVGEGEPCESSPPQECADDLRCRDDGDGARCASPAEPGLEGEPCRSNGCELGLICNDRDDACVTPEFVAVGDRCNYRTVCPMGSTCSRAVDSNELRCRRIAELGETCSEFADRCQLGLTCSDAGTCVEPKRPGESCDIEGQRCQFGYNCVSGVCEPFYDSCL